MKCKHEYRQLFSNWISGRLRPDGFYCIYCTERKKNDEAK